MYDDLVISLRNNADHYMTVEGAAGLVHLLTEAADAIERLSRECKVLYAMLGTHPDPRGELGDPGVQLHEPPKEEGK